MYPQKQTPAKTKTFLDHDEHILVIKRSSLFKNNVWQWLHKNDFDEYLALIHKEPEFHARSLMESELKSGELLSLADCQQYYDQMERWSQIVFDYLKTL